ncbi:MAG TPA: RagB/SusD family nutrient uptake outer membrane protein [Gemmatimonadales bacterium]|nr:RagB/SusD family nutrient uptake outer membrane protein [Gemmatimonadales bacterium]
MNKQNLNRLLYGVAGVIVVAAVTYACSNFLDTPSQGTVEITSLENKAGVEGSLIAAYRSLDCSSSSAGSWGCAASNWVWGSVASDDAYKGSNAGDQQPINDIETYVWSVGEAEGYLNQKWAQVYEGVSRANATLRLLAKVQASNPNEIATPDANSIKGEALFLRAHYHFEAYRMWGHIPYYFETDTTPVSSGGYRKPNDQPLPTILGLIVADLNQAMTLLPATPRNGELGRATKWAAEAYKGRVFAYAAQLTPSLWDSARVVLQDVREKGPYKLETSFDHVWTGFANLQNGPETILAFQASVRDGEPSGWNANWGERLNFPHSGSHFGCCGFHQPSNNLVNFFQVDAAGLPLAMSTNTWNTSPPATRDTNFAAGNLTVPVDPRLDWTVGRDATPYKDWGLQNRSWIRDAIYSGPYSPKKNVHENSANAESNVGWQSTQLNDVNIHIFRYADALLLLAEADIAGNLLDSARVIVNEIRARAGKMAQGCGLTDTTVTKTYPTCATDATIKPMAIPLGVMSASLDTLVTPWANYRIGLYTAPFPDAATATKAVRFERRLELAMEGQRFFDLRRWGAADTTINNYLATEGSRRAYLASASTFQARHNLYPIPDIQIQLSRVGGKDMLVQNTGW